MNQKSSLREDLQFVSWVLTGETTLNEAAEALAVSPSTIRRMINTGLLPAEQLCKGAPWVVKMPTSSGKTYRERQTVVDPVVRRLTIRTRQCLIYKEIARWAVRRALVGAREQCIFPVECDGADGAFDGVVVELDAAVIDEARQALPARQGVADGLGEFALLADQAEFCSQPRLQRVDERPAFLLPDGRRSSAPRPRMSFSTA